MPYRFKVKGDSVGIFNSDGILVAIQSVPTPPVDIPSRTPVRYARDIERLLQRIEADLPEEAPPTGLDAMLKAIRGGAKEGELDETYAPAPSVSARSMMKELHDLPANTSDAMRDYMRNRACMRMFMEMGNVNPDGIGTLVVNQNCHSAALLGHKYLLDLDSRFTLLSETGRGDDCPRLYMKEPQGDDGSLDLGNALRGRELNVKVLEGTDMSEDKIEKLKEIMLVNGHENCTHIDFD